MCFRVVFSLVDCIPCLDHSHLCEHGTANHVVNMPLCARFMLMLVLTLAFFDCDGQEFRARTLAHDVPDTEILQVLANYGISKAILPSEMGGSLTGHQLEWMANRWAAELEEI